LNSQRLVHASQTHDGEQLRAKNGVPSGAQFSQSQITPDISRENTGGQTGENAGEVSGGTTNP
jgi:hypothetical protein